MCWLPIAHNLVIESYVPFQLSSLTSKTLCFCVCSINYIHRVFWQFVLCMYSPSSSCGVEAAGNQSHPSRQNNRSYMGPLTLVDLPSYWESSRCQRCLSRLVPRSAETPLVKGTVIFMWKIFVGWRHCLNVSRFQKRLVSVFLDVWTTKWHTVWSNSYLQCRKWRL